MRHAGWAERFGRLGEIVPERAETWEGRLFLTVDLDWAPDWAIADCLDLVEEARVAATIFVTHDTPLLARMRANPRIELGLHPNFNPLLDGLASQGSAETVMRGLQRIVPEARAVRSHSMTQSSRLLDAARLAMGRGHELVLVGTCAAAPEYEAKEADFARLALEARCPYFCDARINDDCHVRAARASGAEIALSVNWLTLFGAEIIAAFPHGILNAHAGDLPRYRGNACPNWAILNGEDHVGLCVHRVVPELDAGPVVLRTRFPLGPDTYIGEVYAFLDAEIPRMLVAAMEGLVSGALEAVPQPDDPALSLRCFPRMPEDGLIDWREPAQAIGRLVRASAEPFAGAFTCLDGEVLRIWRARPARLPYPWVGIPGQVAAIAGDEVTVLCGRDVLILEEVELDGKRMPPARRIRSLRTRLGKRGEWRT